MPPVGTPITGGLGSTYSKAPTSQLPSFLGTARWSLAGQPVFVPALTAGLVRGSERVWVGPPLAASGPRFGFVAASAPTSQVSSPSRLWSLESTGTAQSLSVLPNTIVLTSVTTASGLALPMPSVPLAVTVAFLSVTGPNAVTPDAPLP